MQAPDGAPGSLKLKVQAEGGDCRFAATASEELDARDAAKKAKLAAAGGETPAASTLGEAGDFITKLKKLTSTLVCLAAPGHLTCGGMMLNKLCKLESTSWDRPLK